MSIAVIAVFFAVKRIMYDINNVCYSFINYGICLLRFSQSGSSLLKLSALSLDESLFPYYRYVWVELLIPISPVHREPPILFNM